MDAFEISLPLILAWLAALLLLATLYAAHSLRIRVRLLPLAEVGVVALIAVFLWLLLVPSP